MGQYWKTVNLDKREFIMPHKLGCGLKLGEQVHGEGVGSALIILLAAMPERRGGGDFDLDSNYYGPERDLTVDSHRMEGAPVVEDYNEVARRTIGRWVGDRVVLVGDYAEDGDLPESKRKPGDLAFSEIYSRCTEAQDLDREYLKERGISAADLFTDITDDVARVIEHETGGRYIGGGWRRLAREGEKVSRWVGQHPNNVRVEGEVTAIWPNVVVKWPDEIRNYGDGAKTDFF